MGSQFAALIDDSHRFFEDEGAEFNDPVADFEAYAELEREQQAATLPTEAANSAGTDDELFTDMAAAIRALQRQLTRKDDEVWELKQQLQYDRSQIRSWGASQGLDPLDFPALAEQEPERPRHIVDPWLPEGYATLIAGHGGGGKSTVCLRMAACLALGEPFFDYDVDPRRVLYLGCEDRPGAFHWRLARICEQMGVDLAALHERLTLFSMVGMNSVLWKPDNLITPPYAWLAETMRHTGSQVLILDGVADVFAGNENDRAQVKQFVNHVTALAPPDGAVLLIHHVSKGVANGYDTQAYSGSTGWHNACRARWFMSPAVDGVATLELQKSNHGAVGESVAIRWDDHHGTFIGTRNQAPSEFDRRQEEQVEVDGIVEVLRELYANGNYCPAASTGNRTAYHVLSVAPNFPESLIGGTSEKRRFWRHIERLRQMGDIYADSIRRNNGHKTEVLRPKATAGTASAESSNAKNTFGEQSAFDDGTSNRRMRRGGIRGVGEVCPSCSGEGCQWCDTTKTAGSR